MEDTKMYGAENEDAAENASEDASQNEGEESSA